MSNFHAENKSEVEDIPEFRDVQIAYCDRQPLPPEQAEAMTYEIVSKVSVDSCGGDREAYQKFLASEQSKQYVQVYNWRIYQLMELQRLFAITKDPTA